MTDKFHDILRIPLGELIIKNKEDFSVRLEGSFKMINRIKSVIENFSCLDSSYFILPDIKTIAINAETLSYSYKKTVNTIPLSDFTKLIRQDFQANFPYIVELCNFLKICLEKLSSMQNNILLPTPITLFFLKNTPGAWRLMPLPAIDLKTEEMVDVDDNIWQTIPINYIRERTKINQQYVIGSILYYCFFDKLMPSDLSRYEKIQRYLMGRININDSLKDVILNSLPKSFEKEGNSLSEIIISFLNCNSNNPINSDKTDELHLLLKDLNSDRIITRWEYEERCDIALKILLNISENIESENVSWERIARLKERQFDKIGALEARINSLRYKQEGSLRSGILYLQNQISTPRDTDINGDYTLFNSFIEVFELNLSISNNELYQLHYAHILMKHLNRVEDAKKYINKQYTDTWVQMLQKLMQIRIFCINKEYIKVSKLCKQELQLLEKISIDEDKMHFVKSYLHIIDAIAYFGAVATFNDTQLFVDSFKRFTKGIDIALDCNDLHLIIIGIQWLKHIQNLLYVFPQKIRVLIETGLDVYLTFLKSLNKEIPSYIEGFPSIPWYNDCLIFIK
jgi:hypothetical protein